MLKMVKLMKVKVIIKVKVVGLIINYIKDAKFISYQQFRIYKFDSVHLLYGFNKHISDFIILYYFCDYCFSNIK